MKSNYAYILFFFIFITLVQPQELHAEQLDLTRPFFQTGILLQRIELIKKNRQFIKKLNRNKFTGLEIVMAKGSLELGSQFGHVFLRFVGQKNKFQSDIGLSFVALIENQKISAIKGLTGAHPIFPLLAPMRLFIQQYLKYEDRELIRIIVPTNNKLRTQLLNSVNIWWEEFEDVLKKVNTEEIQKSQESSRVFGHKRYGPSGFVSIPLKSPVKKESIYAWGVLQKDIYEALPNKLPQTIVETIYREAATFQVDKTKKLEVPLFVVKNGEIKSKSLGAYTFFSNNCLTATVDFLKKSGFPYNRWKGIRGIIPSKAFSYFQRSFLSPYPSSPIFSVSKIKKRYFDKKIPLSNWNTKDLSIIWTLYNSSMETKKKDMVINLLANSSQKINYKDIFNIVDLPLKMYELCSNKSCIKTVEENLNATWDKFEIKKVKSRINNVARNEYPHSGLRVSKDILNHLKLLKYIPDDWPKTQSLETEENL
jgi:hypothetical protein